MIKKGNAFAFYMTLLLYVLLAFVLRLIALAPLLALFAFEPGSAWQYLALLCPLLMVFVVLPLRFSFAEALVQEADERIFSLKTAFSFSQYGEKWLRGLVHAIQVMLWGLPFFALAGYGLTQYASGNLLTFQTVDNLSKLGNRWNNGYYAVINFFEKLLGKAVSVLPANGFMDGVFVVLGAVGIALLIWLYGAVRNSASRYIWVVAERTDRAYRTVCKQQLSGRRWRQLGTALLNLLLCLPFFTVIFLLCKNSLMEAVNTLFSAQTLMMLMSTHTLPNLELGGMAKIMPILLLCCYLALLPLRRCATARFAVAGRHRRAEK